MDNMASDTESKEPKRKPSALPIYLALGFLLVFGFVFIIEFLDLSDVSGGIPDDDLTADSYMDQVTPLLVDADPVRGAELATLYGCNGCHGDDSQVYAPRHSALSEVIADRRPPLQPAAYIYESILYPGAFVVEGYQNNMPRIYAGQIPPEDLGDIIAYLLGDLYSS